MKIQKIFKVTLTLLFLLTLGVSTGIAKEKKGVKSGSMNGEHQGINSGRDFGKHVSGHKGTFSGSPNPGKNHKGYSALRK